jgi:outer membrane protein
MKKGIPFAWSVRKPEKSREKMMNWKYGAAPLISTLLISFLFVMPAEAKAEEIIKRGESLNLERCVEIALKMQPNIAAAVGNVNVNINRVGESKSNYYPQINWASSYDRISSPSRSMSSVSSTGTTSPSTGARGSFDQYFTGLNLNQMIYDFGKTPTQVEIQNLNLYSSRSDLENVSEQVILNVKQAYFGVLQAKRSRDVAADTVKQFQQHLDQAKGFYEVGTKPKFDVTQAEANLSNAKLNLIKAENGLKLAVVTLNNAMGVPAAPEYTIEDNLSFKKYSITFEDALAKAYKERPDLISIVATRQAAEKSVDLANTGYYPALTGNAAYNWSGEKISSLDYEWNLRAALSFPIFNGFLTKYQVQEAKANLNISKANEESLRQSIFSDVQQAYLNLKQAEESIPTAELGVKQAQENFEIATGRYAAGVGSPIDVTDAEVLLANAKLSYIQALYSYKISQANLEKAMGMR